MRLGIFGGTFDPVHYGHLLLAELCREQCPLDEVRFIPAARAPHKLRREPAPAAARVELLRLGIADHAAFVVDDRELRRGGVSFTVDTLRELREEHQGVELFLLLGGDSLADLPGWREPAEICRLATPLVVRRPGTPRPDYDALAGVANAAQIEAFRRHEVAMPQVDFSSSEIRHRIAEGKSIRYQTPPAVVEAIARQGLYADG